jgi:SAM-dependent methyltransferase
LNERINEPGMFFDGVAVLYRRARSDYPAALYDDLFDFAGAGSVRRALEIGCATGQASRSIAERGVSLLCLEPGARLASIARNQLAAFPGVRVECASFEDWVLPAEPFDLVVAANSFQWVDRRVRVPKLADTLRTGGVVALFRRFAVRSGSPLEEAIDAVFPGIPAFAAEVVKPKRWRKECELAGSRLFADLREHRYESREEYTAGELVDLLATWSRYAHLPADTREAGFRRVRETVLAHGDRIEVSYLTRLLLARRAPARFWQRHRLRHFLG